MATVSLRASASGRGAGAPLSQRAGVRSGGQVGGVGPAGGAAARYGLDGARRDIGAVVRIELAQPAAASSDVVTSARSTRGVRVRTGLRARRSVETVAVPFRTGRGRGRAAPTG